jgi:hypothetical protein
MRIKNIIRKKEVVMHLFEIEVKNRVVRKGFNLFRIKGTQGTWYTEILHYLADSEEEAEKFATDEIRNRRMLGIPMTCPPIIGPQVKLFFRGKTLYIGGHYNGQETLHPRADNKASASVRSTFFSGQEFA